MDLPNLHTSLGAVLAPDQIPLHYGDLGAEYWAALEAAVLMERSHEGRVEITGRDYLALPHRMCTNDLESLTPGMGRPTIFTNPNARIIDRVTVFDRGDQTALLLTEPGRGDAVRAYLQRNIFFNDDARLTDLTSVTKQFDLHGPQADAVIAALDPELAARTDWFGQPLTIAGANVFVTRNKPISGAHWTLIAAAADAGAVWSALLEIGKAHGLIPAGSLTYNTLRIRAGRPGLGRELSADYLPLEIGLWDEVSFTKGCYTGQEIIARMESRNRLAKTIVTLRLSAVIDIPAPLRTPEREVGTLTSNVEAPDGTIFGIGVIKVAAAQPGADLVVGDTGISARITGLAGVQPAAIQQESDQ
ncbi:MAG: glycine cleavage system protein T [Chloroflexi bacterium]|nr:glycine cleavage system protein T [Chloroflexota bacterium]